MILQQETFKDTVTGADSEMEFSIDTESSVIFEILRDKMYKDKIGSICREVASNSRDANREAGTDRPIEIKVTSPNKLLSVSHPSISFRDFGAGISPHKMADIYLKYGASDKRTTDKLTGGFGLGAKTPFAYSDTFTVITIVDLEEGRFKYTYTAMIDSSQKGKMILFESKETDEPTGTEVIVPIMNSDDRYKFEREALKYTKTWGDEIIYKGFTRTQEELEVAYNDDNFTLYKLETFRYGSKVELLIDGIPYPLDNEIVSLTDTIGRSSSYHLTVLKFNTGELSISANRESVQYDDKTIEAIQNKHSEVRTTLDTLLDNHVEEQKTYLDACIMTYFINRKSSNLSNPPALTGALLAHSKSIGKKLNNIKWNGRTTVDKFVFKHHSLIEVYLDSNNRNKYEYHNMFHFSKHNCSSPLYYGDARKNSRRNVNVWDEGKNKFFILKPTTDSKEGLEEFMDFIFKFDFDFNLYSDLEVVKKESTSTGVYKKKPYVTLNLREIRNYGTHKVTMALDRKTYEPEEEIDLSKTVYETVSQLSEAEFINKSKLRFCNKHGDYNAIIIREQDYKNWFSNTSIKHVDEVYDKIKEEAIEKLKEKALPILIADIISEEVTDQDRYIEILKPILPKSCQTADFNDNLSYEEQRLVKKELKFDFNGLRSKIKTIFEEKYSLIPLIVSKYRHFFDREEGVKKLELYIKQVNNYYGS